MAKWKDVNEYEPENEVYVKVRCYDWSSWESTAMRKDYKKPLKGCKNAKNYRKGWRWIDKNGDTLSRKELPDQWAEIE